MLVYLQVFTAIGQGLNNPGGAAAAVPSYVYGLLLTREAVSLPLCLPAHFGQRTGGLGSAHGLPGTT